MKKRGSSTGGTRVRQRGTIACLTMLFCLPWSGGVFAGTEVGNADQSAEASPVLGEIIVTAQKRQQNIQDVGMSIQAASGDQLTKLGITDPSQLQSIVPGFLSTPTFSGTTVFTLRGIGFQDTSLGGSPTVSVYLDEAPLPFSSLTNGASLDVQRVEVLKGPQGTLFGNNATGGAVNYVANKPTDHFQAGADLSYGRFNNTDVTGFASGPLTDSLGIRVALRHNESGAWQYGYGPNQGQTIGGVNFTNGRVSLLWKPTDSVKASLTINGWHDEGYNQEPQLYGVGQSVPTGPIDPFIASYPLAPQNNRAAGWNNCVNNSPFDPIANQALGSLWLTPTGRLESAGPGSIVQAGGQPTSCQPPRKNNTYFSIAPRIDWDLGGDVTLTSLTEYQHFHRESAIDASAAAIQSYQSVQYGKIESEYQELRLSGKIAGKGSWLVGTNYEHDYTFDRFMETLGASTNNPIILAYDPAYYATLAAGNPTTPGPLFAGCTATGCALIAFPLITDTPQNIQRTDTYAVFANGEYPILSNLTVHAGVRFTQENKHAELCDFDSGDGNWAGLAQAVQEVFGSTNPVLAPVGGCSTIGPPENNFNSPTTFSRKLNQNNVSWSTGVNWKIAPDDLLYVTVSKGYKGGSFPTIASSTYAQIRPVSQESLLAYEAGFKSSLFNRQLTLNGAAFYYDYKDKQILGGISDPVFGALQALVNVPQSHVMGFELSGQWTPDMLHGLVITPAISYQNSRVDKSSNNTCVQTALTAAGGGNCVPNHFYGFDSFNQYTDFTGERFPLAPLWQGSLDGEYDWKLSNGMTIYVGASAHFTSATNNYFVNRTPLQPVGPASPAFPNDPLAVAAYTLVDLRAGLQMNDWGLQVWGRNVADKYYWTAATRGSDTLIRYAGQPATFGFSISYRFR